jgi:RNA polymerase sigma factor (sigma-70 family)
MPNRDDARIFEETRPVLMGLAYRMLGSRADAEDAVQDTFLKWQQADTEKIENPPSWLTTACTRRCIDLLRSAHKTRVDYVGAWLPEPVHAPTEPGAENTMSLASSLTTAFLLMLERLTPRERAAYLLHEIFEVSYQETARTLAIQESTCRKLVSRARVNIGQSTVRHVTPVDRQEKLLAAFQAAVMTGETEKLAALFSDDIEIRHDSGGKVGAAVHVLRGKADVLNFVHEFLHRVWKPYRWVVTDLNGGRGVLLQKNGSTTAAVSFAYDEAARAINIFIMRNPDKLSRLSESEIR